MLAANIVGRTIRDLRAGRLREELVQQVRTVLRVLGIPSRADLEDLEGRLTELEEITDDLLGRVRALRAAIGRRPTEETHG